MRVAAFCRRHARLRGNALILEQYRRDPYYAVRSEILAALPLEPEALARIAAARPRRQPAGLATIGYEGRSLEGYLNALLQDGVTLLCDVRRNPLSRKYGFSKNTLSRACEGVGLRYEHLPELGIASEQRQEVRTPADYEALFAGYERQTLPRQRVALDRRWKIADFRFRPGRKCGPKRRRATEFAAARGLAARPVINALNKPNATSGLASGFRLPVVG